jgi:hypothetical protein
MSYAETARAFVAAEPSVLPMSEWAEARRNFMSPQTIAANHAFHVSDVAHDLRAMLDTPSPAPDQLTLTVEQLERYRWIERNARALLSAIGETD